MTGATGFVGRAVADALAGDCDVWAVTSGRTPLAGASGRAIAVDLTRPDAAEQLRAGLPAEPFDAIVHAAALTPRLKVDDLARLLDANALGTQHLLDGLAEPPGRVAYVSTVDVYGQVHEPRRLGAESPVAPANWYALSKYAGERVAQVWCARRGVPAAVFRLAQVYGADDPTPKALPTFCARVAAGRPPTVRGRGDGIRQLIHVRDVAGGIAAWVRAAPAPAGTFVLAGREELTIRALAELVMAVGGLPGQPETSPGDELASHYRFDTAPTEAALAWRPRVSLREGVREVLDTLRTGAVVGA